MILIKMNLKMKIKNESTNNTFQMHPYNRSDIKEEGGEREARGGK